MTNCIYGIFYCFNGDHCSPRASDKLVYSREKQYSFNVLYCVGNFTRMVSCVLQNCCLRLSEKRYYLTRTNTEKRRTQRPAGTVFSIISLYREYISFFQIGGGGKEEVLIIRIANSDGSAFLSIINALQDKNLQILHAADLEPSTLTLGDIEIFPEQRRVTKAGVEICLNYGEFSILHCMARCPGQVFSREQLYNAAWGEDYELGTNTVDNTIWRLRNKLEPDPKHPTYIKTVFRVGYKIER